MRHSKKEIQTMELTDEQAREAIEIARKRLTGKRKDIIVRHFGSRVEKKQPQRPVSIDELTFESRNYITPLVIPNDRHNS